MATLIGTEGHDVLQAKADGDLLRGLGGNDALLSTDWVDSAGPHGFSDITLQGGAGADYLFTRGGHNAHENGDSGNDILIADSSASTAANYLYGGAGADDLQAKAEAFNSYENEFEDQKATNSLQGNDGDDVMTAIGSAGAQRATATVVNTLTGGNGNDSMSATGSAGGGTGGGSGSVTNRLDGGNGNDKLVASAGADGNPENNLYGGAGNDRLEATCNLYASAWYNTGVNHLEGGTGDDTLLASFTSDTGAFGDGSKLYGGTGNDSLTVKGGDGVLDGGVGNDKLLGISDAWYDHIELHGGTGNDSLTVRGGEGNVLNGGLENVLDGGTGNDKLFGGAGGDRFDFRGVNGTDAVNGFVHGTDHVRISGYGAALDNFKDLHISVAGGDTHINLSASVAGAGEIILHGVTHVNATDFVFV